MRYRNPALYWVHDIPIRSVLPIYFVGFSRYLKNVVLLLLRMCFLKASNPVPSNFFGPPLISRAMLLLYPYFAMIFGSDVDSNFFTCLSVKKICPSGYSTFGLYTPWYNVNAFCHVTPAVNIDSDVAITVFSNTGNCFRTLTSSGSFQ